MKAEPGKRRLSLVLQPISGKAIEVTQGEVLRITQVGGEQCVDFNCFNLHDYGERMAVGHTRAQGFRLREGNIVVSNPPHYRPMLTITHLSETCVTDLLGARCDGTLGERQWGIVDQTNCQDTLAEAIREYDLTPDDVHDSLNFWMHTYWTRSGVNPSGWAIGPPGDYVEMLALMDILAVPITCGSGDLGPISKFSFKPISVEIFEASDGSSSLAHEFVDQYGGYRNQRSRAQFRVKTIKTDRELTPVPGYAPQFMRFPMGLRDVSIAFDPEDVASMESLVGSIGATVGDVARSMFCYWWLKNRASDPLLAPA